MVAMIPVWLWVTVVLGLATAGPVHTAKTTTAGKDCHLEKFLSMSPREIEAFKKAKEALEERLLLKDSNCSSPVFPMSWDLRQLQIWERPVALQAELTLTLAVLDAVTDPALGDVLEQPLHTLHYIHSQLQACILAQPTAAPRRHSRLLSHWLQRLNQATEKESPGCLQASVTFNLFRLIIRDLRCVARPDRCA